VLFAVVAGQFDPLTAPAEFTVLAAGSAVVASALGYLWPPRRIEAPVSLGYGWLAWAALLIVLGLVEVYTLVSTTPVEHPTLSAISRPLLAPHWHRTVGYVLWMAAGVWVARR
jgi:hypothetical protein